MMERPKLPDMPSEGGYWIMANGQALSVAHYAGHGETLTEHGYRGDYTSAFDRGWLRISTHRSNKNYCVECTDRVTPDALRVAIAMLGTDQFIDGFNLFRLEYWNLHGRSYDDSHEERAREFHSRGASALRGPEKAAAFISGKLRRILTAKLVTTSASAA